MLRAKPGRTRRGPPLLHYRDDDENDTRTELAHSGLFTQHISRLQIHMRAIRHRTSFDGDRVANSVVDHADIVEAISARDAGLAEDLVRRHALGLAGHVRDNVTYLK